MTALAGRSAYYFLDYRRGFVIARALRLPRFGSLASLIFGWDGTTRTGQDACRTPAPRRCRSICVLTRSVHALM